MTGDIKSAEATMVDNGDGIKIEVFCMYYQGGIYGNSKECLGYF